MIPALAVLALLVQDAPRERRLAPADGDRAPAIREALEQLREGGTLILEPGRYLLRGGPPRRDGRTREPSVVVAGLREVVLDGRGATLVGTDIADLFRFSGARNLVVRNLVVDWDPLPHSSGTVEAVHPAEHAYDVRPRVPAEPPDGRIVQGILAYDSARRRLAANGWEIYQTQGERDAEPSRRLPDGRLRVFQKRGTRLPEVGWEVVIRHQVYGHDALVFSGCSGVRVEDVEVRAVPGMAVIGWGSRDLEIRRVKVEPAAGGWMSATADAMHFGACRGTVTVEDCAFAGMGDDAINIHGMYGLATSRPDGRTLEVAGARLHPYYDRARGPWDLPEPGDVLEYGGGEEPLLPRGRLVVAEARPDPAKGRTLVVFREPLPEGVGEGTALWNLSTSPAVRVRRCVVRGNRARGMLLQSRDVLLENCVFEDVSGAGLQICTDARDWWESLGARDVTVKACIFRRCNFGVARRAAALDLFADLAKGRQGAPGVHRGIRILDCVFEDNTGAALHLGSAEDVEVRGCRFAHGTSPVVRVVNSRNVVLAGNAGLAGKGAVRTEGTSDPASVRISD